MMARLTLTLHKLQLLDSELSELRSKLRDVEGQLAEPQNLLVARRQRTQTQTDLAAGSSRLRELEMDLQELSAKIADVEQSLYGGRVNNPKELGALQRDHDFMKAARDKLEDQVLAAMTQVEDSQKGLGEAKTDLESIEERWGREHDRTSKEVEKLRGRLDALTQERAALAPLLTPAALGLYEDLLKKKGGRAVALLVGSMCQGCRVTLPSGRVQQVRQSEEPVTCNNCGRILVAE
jgi:predicted  nucleic acid-binding Zn-ribbon protein